MTNQIGLEFLDIDLGLYVNNLESSSLDSSCSTTSSPIFCSNPNLSYNSNLFSPDCLVHNQLEEQFDKKNLFNYNNNNNNNKYLLNFQPQAHHNININNNRPREHSYSFSESNTAINNNDNQTLITNNSFITNKSSSQLLNNCKKSNYNNNNEFQKKVINKYQDKKVPINKQIRIESKSMQSHVLNPNNQHVLTSQQSLPLISNSYSHSPILLNNNNNNSISSSSSNSNNNSNLFSFSSVSSNNLSRSSSSSPSSIDYNHMRQFSDMAIKSQLQQPSLSHLDLLISNTKLECIKQPLTPNSDENLIKNVTTNNLTSTTITSNTATTTTTSSTNYNSGQPILDLYVSSHNNNNNNNNFDDFNNLNTPTESINQLDFANTIIPPPVTLPASSTNSANTTTTKKQPLLLPKPAPVNNYSTNFNIKPSGPSSQPQFMRNSQISMMIPTITNGIMSRSNSQPDLTLNNLDPNFTNDLLSSTYSSYNSNFGNIGINQNQPTTTSLDNNNNNNNNNSNMNMKNRPKVIRRHPSLSYKTSMSEYNEQDETLFMENFFSNIHTLSTNSKNHQTISNTNSTDDGLFLGTDALSDFISNCGAITDLFEDLPDLEDLMSLVTFESSSSSSAALSSSGLFIIIIITI